VRKLLEARAKPTISANSSNFAFLWACSEGCVLLVKLLLADKRVHLDPQEKDPEVVISNPIETACDKNHPEVMRLLLADERSDPSANNQFAISVACSNGHLEYVKLLLADHRVLPPSVSSFSLSSSLDALAPCLLRRSFRRELLESKHQDVYASLDCRSVVENIEAIEAERKALLNLYLLSDWSSICLDYSPDLFCLDQPTLIDENLTTSSSSEEILKFPRFSFAHLELSSLEQLKLNL
jgi:hypothetical protein